jgi:soluble lytic murein transglycosylase
MGRWLKREYPLSLHGLLAQGENLTSSPMTATTQDPEILFRSLLFPELNAVVRSVELCLERGSLEVASQLLQVHAANLKKAEIPFQLYWAVLLYRAKNAPVSFQLMASIFRENPELISRATLELMYPLNQFEMIQQMSSPVDPYLVLSLIRQESAFNERARSQAGAFGLMQIQLPTARNFERVSRQELYNPKTNVRVGVKFFNRLLSRYQGEVEFALAAYNAGPHRITEWRRRYPVDNRLLFLDLLPIRETRDYVSSIIRNYYWYLNLYAAPEIERRIAVHDSSFFRPVQSKSKINSTISPQ